MSQGVGTVNGPTSGIISCRLEPDGVGIVLVASKTCHVVLQQTGEHSHLHKWDVNTQPPEVPGKMPQGRSFTPTDRLVHALPSRAHGGKVLFERGPPLPGKYAVYAFLTDSDDAVVGSSAMFECVGAFDADHARQARFANNVSPRERAEIDTEYRTPMFVTSGRTSRFCFRRHLVQTWAKLGDA